MNFFCQKKIFEKKISYIFSLEIFFRKFFLWKCTCRIKFVMTNFFLKNIRRLCAIKNFNKNYFSSICFPQIIFCTYFFQIFWRKMFSIFFDKFFCKQNICFGNFFRKIVFLKNFSAKINLQICISQFFRSISLVNIFSIKFHKF